MISSSTAHSIDSSDTHEAGDTGPASEVFISYSSRDSEWAERLNRALIKQGISTWLPKENLCPGDSWRSSIEKALRNAKSFVMLIQPDREPGEWQRQEWGAALESVWDDPTKLLIPLLFRGAEVPSFAKSAAAAGGVVAAFRIENPERDWDRTVKDLVKLLRHKVSPAEVGELIAITQEDRAQQRERLSYVRRAAEAFKP